MVSLVIHGGAWNIPERTLEAHRQGCARAIRLGWELLAGGARAVETVEKVVQCLEDDGTYDAGSGSHLNEVGEIELDASIMNGQNLRCGAVGSVRRVKNPIVLARKIMDDSEHILLVGAGAEKFAADHGVPLCEMEELMSERERDFWKKSENLKQPSKDAFRTAKAASDTVGAVAMDLHGDICVGTSTGGTFKKHPGRVGDSPLIGCGSYADNTVGGVSTTGWGEAMIKVVMAKTVIDILDLNGGDPQAAAEKGIDVLKKKVDGNGGVIVLNKFGKVGFAFNTPRMARAYMNSEMRDPVVEV
jgi:beta-aspartyl-peptidase (threonine type)